MKALIPMNEFGLMAGKDCVARVDSRKIAEAFEKNHFDVLRSIKRIISDESGYSEEFTERNFAVSKYVDETGRKLPCYLLTGDGFVALAMGFTGKKADAFKEQYIKLFNEMEQQILTLQSLRDQHPLLTEAIKATRDDAQPYDYSNEADMMNRIVLGMTAKQYREQHGILCFCCYASVQWVQLCGRILLCESGVLDKRPCQRLQVFRRRNQNDSVRQPQNRCCQAQER